MRKPNILLIGDAMLDVAHHGTVTRVSPEAPLPVLDVQRTAYYAGGAANVARNLEAMGADVTFLYNFGEDEEGRILRGLIGGKSRTSHERAESKTTVKTRGFCGKTQVFRHDRNYTLSREEQREVVGVVLEELQESKFDAVALSDYGRGMLGCAQEIIKLLPPVPIYVDPKGDDWSRYAGATLIKANASEMARELEYQRTDMSGLAAVLKVRSVLETRGPDGVRWCVRDGSILQRKCPRVVGGDPTGAGDTFFAQLVYSLTSGWDIIHSVYRAQIAASIAVERAGTSVVTRFELNHVLENDK